MILFFISLTEFNVVTKTVLHLSGGCWNDEFLWLGEILSAGKFCIGHSDGWQVSEPSEKTAPSACAPSAGDL